MTQKELPITIEEQIDRMKKTQKHCIFNTKKAFRMLVCMFILLFAFCCKTEAKTTKNIDKQAGKAHAKIIERYKDCYDKNRAHVQHDTEERVNWYFCDHMKYYSKWYAKFVYKIKDYNGDNVPELFVGLLGKDGSYLQDEVVVFDAYTFRNGKARQIHKHIGDRTGSVTLCKNRVVADRGSGGAADYYIKFQKISKNGKLATFLEIGSRSQFEYPYFHLYKIQNGKKTIISKKSMIG